MSSSPAFGSEFTQEIRFAVVIYGGSSLAIYMNGVAQELLHLVRATAPGKTPGSLHVDKVSGTERVYRELGRMLDRGKAPKTKLEPQDNIKTRFIIDILSGTSAGGINSVFLAKALANDLDLDTLRNIWLDTADFDVLLNDNGGEGVAQKPPKSLVNSPYLYKKILEALKKMDEKATGDPSPYADQIDLYTTFTDIQGQTVALKLADLVAAERQHLHNFHFTYSTELAAGTKRNDFSSDFNPFLAFAARCTSAHPAAFEPMTLEDIGLEQNCKPSNKQWRKFYSEYLQPVRVERKSNDEPTPDNLADEFLKRPLSDGGVLDNSPFSFAIDQLDFRNVKLPVDRKLIYVEPSPGHPELERDRNEKPDFIQNAVLSLSSLPSYQFIRDDIRRIIERNRLINRVNRILNGMEEDFSSRKVELKTITGEDFKNTSMDDLVKVMGPGWGSYQRLRVEETTDDLVSIVARAAGIDDDADEVLAIQFLVMAWRQAHYKARPLGGNYKTENEFLYDFDLKRHIRRLKFVIGKANELSCFDNRAAAVAALICQDVGDIWERDRNKPEFQATNRKELEDVIERLSVVLKDLYVIQSNLDLPLLSIDGDPHAPKNPLADQIRSFNIDRLTLWSLLEQPSHAARLAAAELFVKQHEKEFEALAEALQDKLGKKFHLASSLVKGEAPFQDWGILTINLNREQAKADPKKGAQPEAILRYYYNHFDHFDMGSYPIIYSTNVGEELDPVEVFRIGPEDSDTPIQDKDARKRKLAGLSLGHFGALLDKPYRVNDIIWGRLDCAERLISALIRTAPAPATREEIKELEDTRKRLIREAQEAIIIEETASLNEQQKNDLGLVTPKPATVEIEKREIAIAEVDRSSMPAPIKELLKAKLLEEDPLTRFVKNFHQLHKENPKKLLETAGRGSRILGRMLDGVADQRNFNSPYLSWTTRLMRIFWGMVEVSLPDRWAHILTVHLLKLLYLFEALMIVGGIFLSSNAVQRFGFAAFAITLAIHCLIFVLRDFTLRRTTWARAIVGVLGTVVIVAALLGIVMLGGVVGIDPVWRMVQYLHDSIAGS